MVQGQLQQNEDIYGIKIKIYLISLGHIFLVCIYSKHAFMGFYTITNNTKYIVDNT